MNAWGLQDAGLQQWHIRTCVCLFDPHQPRRALAAPHIHRERARVARDLA
jgi:hypothetical protein